MNLLSFALYFIGTLLTADSIGSLLTNTELHTTELTAGLTALVLGLAVHLVNRKR